MKNNKKERTKFIISELIECSINEAFTTRRGSRIYKEGYLKTNSKMKEKLKNNVRTQLLEYYEDIKSIKKFSDSHKKEHIKKIKHLSKSLSSKYREILYEERFRIGVSQKIINLFLKYLWAANLIKEPPHCPFDDKIISKLKRHTKNLTNWTKIESIKEYNRCVRAAKTAAKEENISIAAWEMKYWERRSS